MNSFSFSSGTGADLTGKIASMNARRKMLKREKEEQDESVAEAVVVERASYADAVDDEVVDTTQTTAKTPEAPTSEHCRLDKIGELIAKVDSLECEIKKMNKHVNSIAKFIKKGK